MSDYSTIFIPPGESIQRKQRVWRVFTDQHGRKFGAQADMRNNQPIGEFQPQGFNPPWLPPMRFAKWREVGDLDFRWDYVTMASELSGDAASFYQDAITFALENNKPEPEVGGPVDRSIRFVLGIPPLSPAIPLSAEAGDPWILFGREPVNEMLKAILTQSASANGKEALDVIRAKLDAQRSVSTVPLVPTIPAKPETAERVKTIHDVDDPGELADVKWPEFLAVAKARGKMTMTEISVAWAEFKNERAKVAA